MDLFIQVTVGVTLNKMDTFREQMDLVMPYTHFLL